MPKPLRDHLDLVAGTELEIEATAEGLTLPARGKSRHGIRPSLHPGGLRCDSVTYSRYAPSSRLVRRAQERSRCSRDFHHGLLRKVGGAPSLIRKKGLLVHHGAARTTMDVAEFIRAKRETRSRRKVAKDPD